MLIFVVVKNHSSCIPVALFYSTDGKPMACCEAVGESKAPVTGVPSLPLSANKEVQTPLIPPPTKIRPPEQSPESVEEELKGMSVGEDGNILAGKEQQPQVEVEAGLGV